MKVFCKGKEVELLVQRVLVEAPTKCPFTGGKVGRMPLAKGGESVHLYSLESYGSAPVKIAFLAKWVAETEIEGLGQVNLEVLYTARADGTRLVETPADLYTLKARGINCVEFEDGARRGNMQIGEKTMSKIHASIDAHRKLELGQFLAALGITQLGYDRAQKIRGKLPGEFDSIQDWLDGKLLLNADKLGIKAFVKRYHQELVAAKPLIAALQKAGVEIISEPVKKLTAAMVCCLTGDFPHDKDYYHEIIERHGQLWAPRFTKQVTHVVTMNPHAVTKKAQEARAKGLPIINPEQMMILLTEKRLDSEPKV